jgi:hypothetical protein
LRQVNDGHLRIIGLALVLSIGVAGASAVSYAKRVANGNGSSTQSYQVPSRLKLLRALGVYTLGGSLALSSQPTWSASSSRKLVGSVVFAFHKRGYAKRLKRQLVVPSEVDKLRLSGEFIIFRHHQGAIVDLAISQRMRGPPSSPCYLFPKNILEGLRSPLPPRNRSGLEVADSHHLSPSSTRARSAEAEARCFRCLATTSPSLPEPTRSCEEIVPWPHPLPAN